MFTFPRYAAEDPRHAVDLVREHPFALIVNAGGAEGARAPVATHIPVILEPGQPAGSSLVGATLLSHMARVNPHWRSLEAAPEVLVVFSGPHGYVSPTTYSQDPSVPTWNYAAVHLTGRAELITGTAETLAVVEETVRVLESLRQPSWDMSASRERFAELVPRVVAFRIRVEAEQSLFKLSQDLPDDLHRRVQEEFAAGPRAELAELMTRVAPRHPSDPRAEE